MRKIGPSRVALTGERNVAVGEALPYGAIIIQLFNLCYGAFVLAGFCPAVAVGRAGLLVEFIK